MEIPVNTEARLGPGGRPVRGFWSIDGLDEVEALMQRLSAGRRLDRLGLILQEHLSTGGKRLRARLALGSLECLGTDRAAGVGWGAACELLHNATLLHDDLQDRDTVRRGQPAAWVRHGEAQAINAGDLALMLPTIAIDHVPVDPGVKWYLSRSLAWHATEVARGQAYEMELLPRGRFQWSAYASAAMSKTAALFSLPVEGAALCAGRSHVEARELAEAFAPIGLLFQIQDDVLDLYGDKGRREVGCDLREGKVSALVSEHLRLHPWDKDALLSLLALPRDETPEDKVEEMITRFADGGALAAVWQRMHAIEEAVDRSVVLEREPRLHALALELVCLAVAPIAHTVPDLSVRMHG
jgi:geranylgeranyl diphosphate synthase type I